MNFMNFMNFRKNLGWLAAALAVVGGVGTVWGETSPIRGLAADTLVSVTGHSGKMTLVYTEPPKTATLSFADRKINKDSLVRYVVGNPDPSKKNKAGNAGDITVKTNYKYWDVEMKTKNGGLLKNNAGVYLKKGPKNSGGGTSDARYSVELGIQTNSGSETPIIQQVPQDWLNASAGTAVSFSRVFGMVGGSFPNLDDVLNGRTLSAIYTNGFAMPNTTNNQIKFIVNAGLGLTAESGDIIKGNATSVAFSDTLEFRFIASFYE